MNKTNTHMTKFERFDAIASKAMPSLPSLWFLWSPIKYRSRDALKLNALEQH
jgi:hypothetical protein